jgi:isoquinoline 1-oxidoreductase beta subunit
MRNRLPPSQSSGGVTRRGLLIGGGAGVGLVLAWAVWPRRYLPNLTADKGETVFGAWIKIGDDGHVTVAVPQAEHGQGVYTALPQIVADELGADWRTVAVEPAPLNPLYANPLGANDLFETATTTLAARWRDVHAVRIGMMLTAGSSSVRAFEDDLRQTGAAARVLLCKVAAARWGVDWQACDTKAGFVVHGTDRLRFADLAAEAAGGTLPDALPMRINQDDSRLSGQSLPRLDAPSKVDGSANFAGDVRLPDMVFASIRQGPIGDSKLLRVDRAAADRIPGVLQVVTNDRWVAAVGNNWWAANRALDALAPRFETRGAVVTSATIDAALRAALDAPGQRIETVGDVEAVLKDARPITADYRASLAAHAAIETMSATARFTDGRLELWLPTLAPAMARDAAAAATGLAAEKVIIHPMLIGGSFGANLYHLCAEQAAVLAVMLKRPVQLTWSRVEDLLHDRFRPPDRCARDRAGDRRASVRARRGVPRHPGACARWRPLCGGGCRTPLSHTRLCDRPSPRRYRRTDRALALGRAQLHRLLHRMFPRRARASQRDRGAVVPDRDARRQSAACALPVDRGVARRLGRRDRRERAGDRLP